MKQKLKILKFGFVTAILLGLLFIHFYVPRVITEIRNPLVNQLRSNVLSGGYTVNHKSRDAENTIRVTSFDGVELVGQMQYSVLDSSLGTVLLLHGIRSKKEYYNNFSKSLNQLGFNTLAIDLRAHGESGGKHCTFGVKERRDVSAFIDHLLEKNPNQSVGIFGQSLGGAIALQALGTDKRLTFGVVESTFSEFRSITHDYFKYHIGFGVPFFTNYLVDRAGSIADFDPDDASPFKYSSQIVQPVLMVHGTEDHRIDIHYGKSNFSQLSVERSEFISVEKAGHLNVWSFGGKTYMEQVQKFMLDNI